MNDSSASLAKNSAMDNPLIWPIFEVLKSSTSAWKVHVLSAHLHELGYISEFDEVPEKDVFKRNFLIMNALYQLQEILIPEYWLQVDSMDIKLFFYSSASTADQTINSTDPLREYYLEWSNYEATEGEVKRLLNEFWKRYQSFIGDSPKEINLTRKKALDMFELDEFATQDEIRKRWRKLALKWHPDRDGGDSHTFRLLCEAWNLLRI